MSNGKMHADEVATDAALVEQLIAEQCPQWAGLPVVPVPSAGTDNALYHLGNALVVRLPRIAGAVAQVTKEQRWLPQLAPHLPLAIPTPLAQGEPGAGYPFPWSVYRWLPGENATLDRLADPVQAAADLAGFSAALQGIDATGGPLPGSHNFGRGVPLAERDAATRACSAELDQLGMVDAEAATAAWDDALQAPAWDGPPVWLHGDLQSGNLLAQDGRLNAVIDWGALGVGDPACDLQPAWNLFTGEARQVFRETLGIDDATWARGKGWALSIGLIALPYYHQTNPTLAGIARVAIEAVLADT